MKSGFLGLALAAGASPVLPQADSDATRLANLGTTAVTSPSDAALASTLAQWRALQQTDSLPFDSYASFMEAHPGWPDEAGRRHAAERQAASGNPSPSSVIAFFRRFPPQSGAAGVAYAKALLTIGDRAGAADAARTAWRSGALSSDDEGWVLLNFTTALTPADNDARVDMLLWQGQTGAAARALPMVSPARAAVFAARIAFRTKSDAAATLATAADAAGQADAGYIADHARWLRDTGDWAGARAALARTHAVTYRPGSVARWYEFLRDQAQGAAADGQWQTAYDIARQVDDAYPAGTDVATRSYAERDAYTDLVWLAGMAALDHLNRPADAATLFDKYARASRTPAIHAKGWYWAGRASPDAAAAASYLRQASGFPDQFYGQLATERLGRPLAAPPAFAPTPVAAAARAAFDAQETVRAARFLGRIGDWQDQTAFLRQIALDATSDSDHVLADQLSRELARPDLGVMIGRSALQNGLTDYGALGYPEVPVPTGYEGQWTMIHAIARQESQFDRQAISRTGARGLMQLMPGTAREAAGKLGLSYDEAALLADTGYNIQLGSSYFQRIYGMYGNYVLALAAYNAGPGNVRKWIAANGDPRTPGVDTVRWIEQIPFHETRGYVQRVLENAVVYDLLNPGHALSRGPANLSWYLGKGTPG